jgi:hypothetical protein
MYGYFKERKLSNAVNDAFKALVYVHSITVYCYYGGKEYFNYALLQNLFQNFDIVENILFNLGYMWTDIIMLVVGKPGLTETDYGFYVAFYVGDFIFRFIFRSTTADEGNCWYPWIECRSETTVALDAAASAAAAIEYKLTDLN